MCRGSRLGPVANLAAPRQIVWKAGRYGYGQVMLANGHLVVLTEGGELALVRATPEAHTELARFPVLDGSSEDRARHSR